MDPTTTAAAGTTPAAGQGTAAPAQTPATPATPAAPAAGEEYKGMSPDQFRARLEAERTAGLRGFLKELGIDDPAAVKATLAKAREAEQATLSVQERLTKQVSELEPRAKRAADLEKALADSVAADLATLPQEVREFIEATVGDDPVARRRAIDTARAKKLGAAAAPPPSANLKAGGTPPPAGQAPAKRPAQMTDAEFAAFERERRAKYGVK